MGNSLELYRTVLGLLIKNIPHSAYGHLGRLYTLAWAIVGLLLEKCVSLTIWASVIQGHAQYAASRYRRLQRWMRNHRVKPHAIYGPLIKSVLSKWEEAQVYISLDTTMLWNKFVVIRASLVYRGRAIPLAWKVMEHASATVAFTDYAPVLRLAAQLLPADWGVTLLADRGFCDEELFLLTKELGWHYRIRGKGSILVYRKGKKGCKMERLCPPRGEARFFHDVRITRQQIGPVHLALAWPANGQGDPWYVISDEPTDLNTFAEYGLRFDIEENFLDDKSGAFQVQKSEIDSADSLSRLCLVLAVATLYLVSTGVEVVASGKRRLVDTHWDRGLSYLQIGWRWLRRQLSQGAPLPHTLELDPRPDPEPARASRRAVRSPPSFETVAAEC